MNNPEIEHIDSTAKRPRIFSPSSSPTAGATLRAQTFPVESMFSQDEPRGQDSQITILPSFASYSVSDVGHVSDSESGQYVGSSLAGALNRTTHCLLPETSDQSSVATPLNPPAGPRDVPLEGRSRALSKEYFAASEALRLPPGHPTIALTEGQISTMLRVVADETARASLKI